jgi:hypothetical protein
MHNLIFPEKKKGKREIIKIKCTLNIGNLLKCDL